MLKYFTKGCIRKQVHVVNPTPKKNVNKLMCSNFYQKENGIASIWTKRIKAPNYILKLILVSFTPRILCNETEYFLVWKTTNSTDGTFIAKTVCSSSEQGKLAAENLTGPILSTAQDKNGKTNELGKWCPKILNYKEIFSLWIQKWFWLNNCCYSFLDSVKWDALL